MKKILSVGMSLPDVERCELSSDRSLLDADIVFFLPGIPYDYQSFFEGKPKLSSHASFMAKESMRHWCSEIKSLVEAGKLVVVFLARPIVVFVDTGQREFSGTGRNTRETNYVEQLSSYEAFPVEMNAIPITGNEIRPVAGDLKFLAPYWKEFGKHSFYSTYLEGKFTDILLKTRSGDRTVGAAVRVKAGMLLLLPQLNWPGNDLAEEDDPEAEFDDEVDETSEMTDDELAFGRRLISTVVNIADYLHAEMATTPAPVWSQSSDFRFAEEPLLESQIEEKTRQIEILQSEKHDLQCQLDCAGNLRRLLYETGHVLEAQILVTLRLMGFVADSFDDGKSEFDAVFSSNEGRFLGEAEGKDNKAINIEKLSQLERNLQEDFARDEITEHAKGVLFGNAFRLSPLHERGAAFTEKCITGAKRLGVALVRTQDLFEPARYLKENADDEYARACREAIFSSSGTVVEFPRPPIAKPVETIKKVG